MTRRPDSPPPTVDIVVLNYNGREHLDSCFRSLLAMDYPRDRYRVVCVDNASADGSPEWIRTHFPAVVLVEPGMNLGFAAGCNLGARLSNADFVAFINNDMRVDSGWLRAMVDTVAEEPDHVCASGRILDWEGRAIDFTDAQANFHGFGQQGHSGEPVTPERFSQPQPILFPCGGAMLVSRRLFLEVGAFDEDYFMCHEDFDFGWRLWLFGHRVSYVPDATVYHRHHGSLGKVALSRRVFLFERNALLTLVKNLDEANLARLLPAAILLAVHRATDWAAQRDGGPDALSPEAWLEHNVDPAAHKVHHADLAPIVAIRDVVRRMPAAMAKRARVQARRLRSDADVFALFGQPLRMHPVYVPVVRSYAKDHLGLVQALGIAELFKMVKTRVLILADAGLPSLGGADSAAGRRAEALGHGLEALGHEVRYALPRAAVAGLPISPLIDDLAWEPSNLDALVLRYNPDVLVATHWHPLQHARRAVFRPVVLDFSPSASDALAPDPASALADSDYLASVDLFTAPDPDRLAALRQWLAQRGQPSLDPDRLRVVPAVVHVGGAVQGIEALDDFCQAYRCLADKRPAPDEPTHASTPLWQLPAKAVASARAGGMRPLFRHVAEYARWRRDQLRRWAS